MNIDEWNRLDCICGVFKMEALIETGIVRFFILMQVWNSMSVSRPTLNYYQKEQNIHF